jgi:hypothetical protein
MGISWSLQFVKCYPLQYTSFFIQICMLAFSISEMGVETPTCALKWCTQGSLLKLMQGKCQYHKKVHNVDLWSNIRRYSKTPTTMKQLCLLMIWTFIYDLCSTCVIVRKCRSRCSCQGHQDDVLCHQAHITSSTQLNHMMYFLPKILGYHVFLNSWLWTLG